MKIKTENGEFCTYCANHWKHDVCAPEFCGICGRSDKFLELVEEAHLRMGVFECLSHAEIAKAILQYLSVAVPPMTVEELCVRQPNAKIFFEDQSVNWSKEGF